MKQVSLSRRPTKEMGTWGGWMDGDNKYRRKERKKEKDKVVRSS